MTTFVCRTCGEELPIEEEVITRFRSRTCRRCWGLRISRARRARLGISQDVCIRCRAAPAGIQRRRGKRKRDYCVRCRREIRRAQSERQRQKSGKLLIPRGTTTEGGT